MMVVIGIIAILGAVAIPGFKKIYSDFKIKETYAFIDDLFSFQISSYLVYNEWPIGANWDSIGVKQLPFLSQRVKKLLDLDNIDYYESNGIYRYRSSGLYRGLYLFPNDRSTAYAGHVRFTIEDSLIENVYYLDDLLERYRRKGCVVTRTSSYIFVKLPGGDHGLGYYFDKLQYR